MLLEAALLACVILPFTCCFEFIWIWIKRSGKMCLLADIYLNPRFFPLRSCSNFWHAKWLDVLFHSCTFLCAFWDLTCSGRERVCSISPRICMQRAENINRPSDTILDLCWNDSSCQMFWTVEGEMMHSLEKEKKYIRNKKVVDVVGCF